MRWHVRRRARFFEVESGPHAVAAYYAAHLIALEATEDVCLRAKCHVEGQRFVFHASAFVGPRAQFRVMPN